MKKSFLFFCMMASCIFLHGCFNNKPKEHQGFPIVDLTKKYPEMDFFVDDADKEFIQLETTNEVLADQDFSIEYVSDERIVGVNRNRGDIFIFGSDGKVISHFNSKGNSGIDYQCLQSIVFDEKRQEIFVADDQSKKRCVVYSEKGKFIRQFYFPENSSITKLYNFDEQTLLAYNCYLHFGDIFDIIDQKMPYVFLSKNDGSIVSRVEISFHKRISDDFTLKLKDNVEVPLTLSTSIIVKYGQKFIIADRSSDTVFLMTQDKKLTPLYVRKPSVFDEKPLFVIPNLFVTDRYLYFHTLPLSYDIWVELMSKYILKGLPTKYPIQHFAYDLQTSQVFNLDRVPFFKNVDASENTVVKQWLADELIEDLENGKLDGKLKMMAQNINEEDNPVIEIIKFR